MSDRKIVIAGIAFCPTGIYRKQTKLIGHRCSVPRTHPESPMASEVSTNRTHERQTSSSSRLMRNILLAYCLVPRTEAWSFSSEWSHCGRLRTSSSVPAHTRSCRCGFSSTLFASQLDEEELVVQQSVRRNGHELPRGFLDPGLSFENMKDVQVDLKHSPLRNNIVTTNNGVLVRKPQGVNGQQDHRNGMPQPGYVSNNFNGGDQNPSVRSLWKRRHARSIFEGIRREKTTEQLSSLLKKARHETMNANRRLISRTITGVISAVAEEADGLEVEVHARKDSPLWEKQIDSIKITFNRLGFQPLRIGGLHNAINKLEDSLDPYEINEFSEHLEMTALSCINEAFERIDADNSGTLDRDEIAMALDILTDSSTDSKLLTTLASDLVELYDTNGDGVVDFEEYQLMVEDMAALRRNEQERWQQQEEEPTEKKETRRRWYHFWRDEKETEVAIATFPEPVAIGNLDSDEGEINLPAKGTGTITLSDLKLDLSRLLFGAVPLIKSIMPGGPLVLEPFTATIHGSFSSDDVMASALLDAGLRRLVARALRRRVRSFRDIIDGAFFFGRTWNMASKSAPVVEVPSLTEVEFDRFDRMIVTGRARVRASPDAPVIENAFKVRTKLGTRKNGQVIRLDQPELALVLECPRSWEKGIVSACHQLNLTVPTKPEPLYSFFPIYSPFKVEDNDGFDLGDDNCIKSIYIKDGALRFELQSILRPGRFLGSHYVAFTVPMRTFLITMERVVSGIRAARKSKREAAERRKAKLQTNTKEQNDKEFRFAGVRRAQAQPALKKKIMKAKKSFFSRFVEGYLGGVKNEAVRNDRLTFAISEWFGRQGSTETSTG